MVYAQMPVRLVHLSCRHQAMCCENLHWTDDGACRFGSQRRRLSFHYRSQVEESDL